MHTIPIVQEYTICSEGPILEWLKLVVKDKGVTHYNIGSIDGVSMLEMYWHPGNNNFLPLLGTRSETMPNTNPVRNRWVGPTREALAAMIDSWLETVEYPPAPDCDGSVARGWKLTNGSCWGYKSFSVMPNWQEYHK
jgi:hypothetical protein